jgi:undecaprenyl-diphosphatase
VDERADAEPVMPDPVASADGGNDPVADWLAQRLVEAGPAEPPDTLVRVLRLLGRWDRLTYVAVAGMSTPLLDEPMRIVSRVADHSKPWFATAAVVAAAGSSTGRRAALAGLAAVGATSLLVNQPLKLAGSRRRPGRLAMRVPVRRWVPMPSSTSFPSGHAASAAAFAVAVGDVFPRLRLPLGVAAAIVGFPASTPVSSTPATSLSVL